MMQVTALILVAMLPSNYDTQDCSVARALEILGERWTLLIVRDALHGVTHYEDFLGRLGAPTSTLARRLDHLVDCGILTRHSYKTRPPREEYRLTRRGRELGTVVAALREWGDRHVSPDGPPASYKHRGCGGTAVTEMKCGTCGHHLDAGDITRTEHRPLRRAPRHPAPEPDGPH
jgi:DNA-binding HxlR family transcriptional regulator